MADFRPIRRRSYEKLQEIQNDGVELMYRREGGHEPINDVIHERHQKTILSNRSIQCSFCPEKFPSTTLLRDHLMSCGNKTDQCPYCHRFIRRSYFTYHYENNCAQVDEIETPPMSLKSRTSPRYATNSNQPVSREDIAADQKKTNYNNENLIIARGRPNGQIQNNMRPTANGQNIGNGIVHIPCEYCNESIDLPNWSIHTSACRERDNRRLLDIAQSISKTPVNEQIPCEYCQTSYSGQKIQLHQKSCPRNPSNRASAGRVQSNERQSRSNFQPIDRLDNPRSESASSYHRPRATREQVHYQSIDVDRTHAANRLGQNDRSIGQAPLRPIALRRIASDEIISHKYSTDDIRTYEKNSNDSLSRSNRSGRDKIASRTNETPQRSRASAADIDERPNSVPIRPDHYVPFHKVTEYADHSIHQKDRNLIRINNQPNEPLIKKKKPSWIKRYLCGSSSNAVD